MVTLLPSPTWVFKAFLKHLSYYCVSQTVVLRIPVSEILIEVQALVFKSKLPRQFYTQIWPVMQCRGF